MDVVDCESQITSSLLFLVSSSSSPTQGSSYHEETRGACLRLVLPFCHHSCERVVTLGFIANNLGRRKGGIGGRGTSAADYWNEVFTGLLAMMSTISGVWIYWLNLASL
jgi:hypothetical protein